MIQCLPVPPGGSGLAERALPYDRGSARAGAGPPDPCQGAYRTRDGVMAPGLKE